MQRTIMRVVMVFVVTTGIISAGFSSELQAYHSKEERSPSPFDYMIRESYYGEMLSWKDVRPFLSNNATFPVIDLDTGFSFYVQKRAGKQHADVQPLTKNDTHIMKEIYNGKMGLEKAGDTRSIEWKNDRCFYAWHATRRGSFVK